MTKDEFAEWIRYHRAAFVGLSRWLDEIPLEATSDMQPTRQDVLRSWCRILADTALEDAKAATDSMARGDDEEPMGWDRHPRAIRTIAARIRRSRSLLTRREVHAREELLSCLICRDAGYLHVWHWRSLQAALDGTLGRPGTLYTMAVPCTCRAGDRYAGTIAKIRGGQPDQWRYNDQQHLVAPMHLDSRSAQSDLKVFAEALRDASIRSRRYEEFEQFSGGFA